MFNFIKYLIHLILIIKITFAKFPFGTNYHDLIEETDLFYFKPSSRISRSNNIILDDTSLSKLGNRFSPKSKDIKIIIHGWRAHRNHIAVTPIRDAYLLKGHDAVFMADWGSASAILYFDSRYFVKPVGLKIAKMIEKFVRKQKIELSQIHLIGHSLGAHIAGNIGQYFNGTIGRITGLDPAGPLFEDFVKDGLMPKHAKFVDCIHTDAPILGQYLQRGHVDFYPNYGKFGQPGCEFLDLITGTSCSHYRAPLFFAESIELPHNFPAFSCSSQNLLTQRCNTAKSNNIAVMGEYVLKSEKELYFLRTNGAKPFGKGLTASLYSRLQNNSNLMEAKVKPKPKQISTTATLVTTPKIIIEQTTSVSVKATQTTRESTTENFLKVNDTIKENEKTLVDDSDTEDFIMETTTTMTVESDNVKL
ncbi:endothelial lipase-like [Condylostylus longicornis]|uniref:endothelial lipase-like n=1 Tax=Condylostylus longicornis TaxID=2530218 RepID=UPI00244DADD9|nr:endothelial lipase-like [Condylostylus longicornis]